MATRIRKRTTIVTSPAVAPVVRQAIADLSRNQNASLVNVRVGYNFVLAANDLNANEISLDSQSTYYLPYQNTPISPSQSQTSDYNNQVLWNSVIIRGGKDTIVCRSKTTDAANGCLWIGATMNPHPTRYSGGIKILIENITFEVPVQVSGAGFVTFRNCCFKQVASPFALCISRADSVVVDGCVFESRYGVGFTAIWLDRPGHHNVIKNSYTNIYHPFETGVKSENGIGGLQITGCDFSNPDPLANCVAYDFRNQDMKYVTCSASSNAGVIVT
jgi:hypothetical protein